MNMSVSVCFVCFKSLGFFCLSDSLMSFIATKRKLEYGCGVCACVGTHMHTHIHTRKKSRVYSCMICIAFELTRGQPLETNLLTETDIT